MEAAGGCIDDVVRVEIEADAILGASGKGP
jgi:hypothetical protein